MRLNFLRRAPSAPAPIPAPMAPTASDHARALGQIGRDADRARRLAMARELCRCTGQTIPAILNDKDA